MKNWLMLIVLLLCASLVNADTEIFSGTLNTGADHVIDEGIFRFNYDSVSNKVFARTPINALIIDTGNCKNNDLFKVCINKVNFSHKNITTQAYYYELDVDIDKLTGEIDSESSFTEDDLLKGHKTTFSVTLKNPTNIYLTDVSYKEDFDGFDILGAEGCELKGAHVTWKGIIYSNSHHKCSINLIAEESGAYNFGGNVSYFNGFEIRNETLKTASVTIQPNQLEFSYVTDDVIEIMNPFHYNISLKNINSENIVTTFEMELSNYMDIVKTPKFIDVKDNSVKERISMQSDEVINYSFVLQSGKEGVHILYHEFQHLIGTITEKFNNKTYINVTEPMPIIGIISEFDTVKPGAEFFVLVNMANPSINYEFKDIVASLSMPYNSDKVSKLQVLSPKQNYSIISQEFNFPDSFLLKGINSFKIDLEILYSLEGQRKKSRKSIELFINQNISKNLSNISKIYSNGSVNESILEDSSNEQFNKSEKEDINLNYGKDSDELPKNIKNPKKEQVQTIIDNISQEKTKIDFADKKIWIMFLIIFASIFIVPLLIFNLSKSKRDKKTKEESLKYQDSDANKPKDI